MRFLKPISILLCMILLLSPVLQAGAAENGSYIAGGCRSVDAQVPLSGEEKLGVSAKSYVVYERTTGTLIASYNIDSSLSPASMVKLMTALVAMENGTLTDVVTVTGSALNSVAIGSVSAGLVRGEEITLENLLGCMCVASANDAAAVIAEYIGGSQAGFVDMMNAKARELGCTDTVFSDPTGLDDTGNQMSTRDILRILDAALENETFRTMFQLESWTVEATNKSEQRELVTTNNMMSTASKKYFDERVTGGKTGATNKAGRCLAVTAQVGDMEIVAIVMGSKATYANDGLEVVKFGSFEDMKVLLDHADQNYECRQLFYQGQVIAQYPVINGSSNVAVTVADEVYCVLPKTVTVEQLVWQYDRNASVSAPVAQGQDITDLSVWYEPEEEGAQRICLAGTELVAMTGVSVYEAYQVPQSSVDKQQEQEHGQVLATVFAVVLGIIVVGMIAMVAMRAIQTARLKARIRRRRTERRRNRHARME